MMRTYETVYILDPSLEEDQQNALVERFQTLVANNGGAVEHVDRWERRRLAYEIAGRREGYYVVMNFQGAPATHAELDRILGITDGVLRHQTVRMDERTAQRQIADAKASAEAKAKAAAEARAAAEAAAAQAAQAAAAEPAATPATPAAVAAPAAPAAAAEAAAPETAAAPEPAAEEAPAATAAAAEGAEAAQETE
ncbi:MAG TPA: 30S ribosomal protein S6 [Armatimonadota bacterium]|nr:30S ribosomal protein S6 [Armatimonadota bacterium]